MLELFQPAALENIVKHHPAQIKAQESQHTILSDALAVYTTVFVKIEVILGKLEDFFAILTL